MRSNTALHLTPPATFALLIRLAVQSGVAGERPRWAAYIMLILHPKPDKFSDPFHDWMGCEKTLTDILAKDKTSLDENDYNVIFAKILPAANYEEGAYYLDSCFDFMRRKQSDVESHICEGVFHFINCHSERLEEDRLLHPCLEEIVSLFQSYAVSFDLIRLTDTQLKQYGMRASFQELPKYSRVVTDLVDYLVEYELFSAVLNDLVSWLNQDDVHKSCWWIDLAYHVRWWYVTYDAADMANSRRQRLIDRLLDLNDYSFHMWKHIDFVRKVGYSRYEKRVSLT